MSIWPHEDIRALMAFYGDPRGHNGEASVAWQAENLVAWTPPYPLFYSDADKTPLHHLRILFVHLAEEPPPHTLRGELYGRQGVPDLVGDVGGEALDLLEALAQRRGHVDQRARKLADLVAFSGGKAIGGPQASGILASQVLIAQEAPGAIRGAVIGMVGFFGALGILAISKIGGIALDTWRPGAPFIIMAGANVELLVLAFWVRGKSPAARA